MDDGSSAAKGNGILTMYAGHEERIQRLESEAAALGASVAENNMGLQALSIQLQQTSMNICERLESIDAHLGEKLASLSNSVKELDSRTGSNHSRIRDLEKDEATKKESTKAWKAVAFKVLTYTLTSGAAAAAALLLEHFAGK